MWKSSYKVDASEIRGICAFVGIEQEEIDVMLRPTEQNPGWSTDLVGGKVSITPDGDGLLFQIEVIFQRWSSGKGALDSNKGTTSASGDRYKFSHKHTKKLFYPIHLESPSSTQGCLRRTFNNFFR